jgi:hypothetical protein
MKSDDPQLAEVAADFDRRRAREGTAPETLRIRPIPPAMSDTQADAFAKRQADYAVQQ